MRQNLLVSGRLAWALSTHGASEEGKLLAQEEIHVLVLDKYTALFFRALWVLFRNCKKYMYQDPGFVGNIG